MAAAPQPQAQVQPLPKIVPPYILIDVATGTVLKNNDALRPWYPASTTKLMSVYTVFDALRAGRVKLDTPVVVSAHALEQPPSKMGFPVGTELTLDDALKIMMVKSANDIAMAVAETVGGSEQGFAELMNAEAQRLNMTHTHYANPHGLPNPDHYTTARDMAVLARALMTEFPEYRSYFKIPAIQFGKKVIRNYNTLIDRYPGATGMKTGFICASGYNLVASAERDGHEVLAVVLGARSGKARGEQAAALLNEGLQPSADKVTGSINLDNVSSGISYTEPFDMKPIVCPDHRQAVAADNPETDEATTEDGASGTAPATLASAGAAGKAASLLGPRFFVGPPVVVHANIPPAGSAVAARPGPLPRARPPFVAVAADPNVTHAFVEDDASPAKQAAAALIAEPAAASPRLPKARPAH